MSEPVAKPMHASQGSGPCFLLRQIYNAEWTDPLRTRFLLSNEEQEACRRDLRALINEILSFELCQTLGHRYGIKISHGSQNFYVKTVPETARSLEITVGCVTKRENRALLELRLHLTDRRLSAWHDLIMRRLECCTIRVRNGQFTVYPDE